MPFLLKQDCFIVIVLTDIVNVLPCFAPPKTLFWTLFWGCDGCHRFLGVGGVGFGGLSDIQVMFQHDSFEEFLAKIFLCCIFGIFISFWGVKSLMMSF
jgi:hypothetical protein